MIRHLKNVYHLAEALLSSYWYGHPSHHLKLIGVTGTDGKTTTTSLIYHILKNTGKQVSMCSTVFAKIGNKEYDTGLHTTTPRSSFIQQMLKRSYLAGDEYFVLETTSHALDQYRVHAVTFEISVVTNVTHEHLDYHKTIEKYAQAKAKLIRMSRIGLLNKDDPSYSILKNILKNNASILTYSVEKDADYHLDLEKVTGLKLTRFNKQNYLAAYAVCRELGLPEKDIITGLISFRLPPGRLETVYEGSFRVMIDFAHTPHSLQLLLGELRDNLSSDTHLIHVFGAAGKRDTTKRPLMGAVTASASDFVILTEEDYRTDKLEDIFQQIGKGMEAEGFIRVTGEVLGSKPRQYSCISDRFSAIEKAISIARPGDTVIITGKGHEKSLCRGRTEIPWDEKKAIISILEKQKLV